MRKVIKKSRVVKKILLLGAAVMIFTATGCGSKSEEIDTSDNAAVFGEDEQSTAKPDEWSGKTLQEFMQATGEEYVFVSGDTVRTGTHTITVNRANGDDLEQCKITSCSETEHYEQYEGITYKEYVHQTEDRQVLQVIRPEGEDEEESAYIETGNHVFLYFKNDVPSRVKDSDDVEELFDITITTCTF